MPSSRPWVPAILSMLFVCAVTVTVLAAPLATEPPVVSTTAGEVRGTIVEGVVAFKGIPFAAPPVGGLRWRAPQPPEPWEGVRDAVNFGSGCQQTWQGELSGDEDCLYLNVWAPDDRNDGPRPVLFWIHGGGFTNGGTSDPRIDGAVLAREGLVVVSGNYRLGRFGFFAHPALTAERADGGRLGNYGIMDQIAALEWVRDNVAAFGGDPDRVTIAGMSAVHHLMTSPLARGLFAQAISESGFGREHNDLLPFLPLSAGASTRSAESVGLTFAAQHGIGGEGPETLKALRALPAAAIVGDLNLLTRFSQPDAVNPIRDGVVLPAHHEQVYEAGEEAPIPLILGANDADGFYLATRETREQIFAWFGALREKAAAIYDPAGADDIMRIGTLYSANTLFLEPARRIARLHAANGHPTYLYRFSYVADHERATAIGAAHSTEVPYVFGTIASFFTPSANDRRIAEEMRAYWVEFMRGSEPAPADLPAWPRLDPGSDLIMDFRLDGATVGPDPARERLDLVERAAQHALEDPDALTVHKNVVYGMHGGLALLMDVYEPAESNGHALLFIAGSGWHWPTDYGAGGIKDAVASGVLGGGSQNVFADAGFTVFVINHRQAPLFRYPAAVEDARRAVRYIRHHGEEYGVTADAIAAFGISSGAHLVLMLALGDGDGDPDSADEVERRSCKVDVVAAFAAPTDLSAEDWVDSIGASYVASFIGAPLGGFAGGAHAEASPITYVDDDDPPVLLLHGDADEVVPVGQARTLAASLREHDVDVEYMEIAGGRHNLDAVLNADDPNELPAFPAMARWLRDHLPEAD